jgi:hypothetical protein
METQNQFHTGTWFQRLSGKSLRPDHHQTVKEVFRGVVLKT